MAMMTTTTKTSSNVKPRSRLATPRVNAARSVEDVGIVPLATWSAIGSKTVHIDLAAHARIEVLVVVTPRILRDAVEVTALFPVGGDRLCRRPLDERG